MKDILPSIRQRAAAEDVQSVLDAIRRIVRALRITSRTAEKKVGLSTAQLFVLSKLADASTLSLNQLAHRTLTDQSSVSVVVQRLVSKRLVRRMRSPHDARQLELSLTPRGRLALKKAPGPAQDRLIRAIHSLPPTQRRLLAKSLARLLRAAGLDDRAPAPLFDEETA